MIRVLPYTFALFLLSMLMPNLATAQNSCEAALEITPGVIAVDSIFGTGALPERCAENQARTLGNWYKFTAVSDTLVIVTTQFLPQSTDSYLHVYTGECGMLTCIGGDDDSGPGLGSSLEFSALAGNTYYVLLDNTWGTNGDYQLSLSFAAPLPPGLINFEQTEIEGVSSADAIVDMNGDYLDDIVNASGNGASIAYQNADGTFTNAVFEVNDLTNGPDWSVAAGDLDANGYNDLVYGGGGSVSFLLANEDGTAYEAVNFSEYVFSQRSNFVDINLDGHLDAFVCHDVEPNVFFLNDGENNLSFNQGSIGDTPDGGNYGSVWIDYNNDGLIDMFMAKCRGGNDSPASINQLHRNNGDGTFTEVQEEVGLADALQTWSAAWGDFDLDGDLDVFVGASSFSQGGHKLMRNDGGMFVDATAGTGLDNFPQTSIETVTHDFDNDGYLDIYGAGRKIWINNGDMTFTPSSVPFSHGPIGDINNDGFLDLVGGVNFEGGNGGAYLGEVNDNNYFKVNLLGNVSNRNGIGARVEIFSDLGHQTRTIKSGDGFAFMSSLNAHFGLGADTSIDSLTITWPSGIKDVVLNPAVNSTLLVEEGSMISSTQNIEVLPLSIYPNPTRDLINFQLPDAENEGYVRILDLNGRLVASQLINDGQLNVSHLPTGSYVLYVKTDSRILRAKFIKE